MVTGLPECDNWEATEGVGGENLVSVRLYLFIWAALGLCAAQALLWLQRAGAALWLWQGGSEVVAHGLSCSACGIFPDQGLNLCLLHWQADSLSLTHRGSPVGLYLK